MIIKNPMQSSKLEVVLTQANVKLPLLENERIIDKTITTNEFTFAIIRKKNRFAKNLKSIDIGRILRPFNKSLKINNKLSTIEVNLKQIRESQWVHEFKDEINEMKINIPNLGHNEKEASPMNISVTDPESGRSIGGITILILK